ncbi:NAD-dependent DNA ligase LigA, partial [bacterium]|nr:NAD-dependent DNA ligase LigA [bacterium]
IDGIGEKIGQSVIEFFKRNENLEIIGKLQKAGAAMERADHVKKEKSIAAVKGRSFVLTGALSRFSREEASDLIRKYGGKVTSSVSKNTDYLLVGENPGSKHEKAVKLDVKIINETEFIEILGSIGI